MKAPLQHANHGKVDVMRSNNRVRAASATVVVAAVSALLLLVTFSPFQSKRDAIFGAARSGDIELLDELVHRAEDADIALEGSVFRGCSAEIVNFALSEGADPDRNLTYEEPSTTFGVVVESPLHIGLLNESCSEEALDALFEASSRTCAQLLEMENVGGNLARLSECG